MAETTETTVRPTYAGFVGTPTGSVRLDPSVPWPADDPFVAANPHLFAADDPVARPARQRRATSR